MSGNLDGAKDELLARAADVSMRAPVTRGGGREQVLDFLRMYYRHVAYDDLEGRDPLDVYGAAVSHRALGETRRAGQARVHAYTPTLDEHGWEPGHSVVEIVTDDMPFLVDSVTMELGRQDLAIHMVVHPQLQVHRDAEGALTNVAALGPAHGLSGDPDRTSGSDATVESWMHIEVDRQPEVERLQRLERDLERVLADVRQAYED